VFTGSTASKHVTYFYVVDRPNESARIMETFRSLKPRSHRARRRASNQTNVKDRKHSHRPRRHRASSASTNLHTSNERSQFKLYIGYWTSNNNKWPKCSCRYQTPPDNIDVIDNGLTENDVIDSWMNMHTLLANRPNVVASTRVDAMRRDATRSV